MKIKKNRENVICTTRHTFAFCPSLSAQSSKTSGFSQDSELKRRDELMIDPCGPAGMHRKSLEAAEHLKSGGEDSGNDHGGSGASPPHHNHHPGGGPTSSESGQESQDGIGPSSSSGEPRYFSSLGIR